jgi:putative addiction module CopG family antidote
MTISLSPELETCINAKVSSGAYGSPAQVVEAALKLLDKRDEVRKSQLAYLRESVQQADDGMLIDADEVFDEILREIDEAAGAEPPALGT